MSTLLNSPLYLGPPVSIELDAPITTAGNVVRCKVGNTLRVPVKVKNFFMIQAITLRLEYSNSVLEFLEATPAVTTPGTPIIRASVVDSQTMKIKYVWSSLQPFTLKNNNVLVWLTFRYKGGETKLYWNTESSGGHDCEYAIIAPTPTHNIGAVPLNDKPRDQFYFDGFVTYK